LLHGRLAVAFTTGRRPFQTSFCTILLCSSDDREAIRFLFVQDGLDGSNGSREPITCFWTLAMTFGWRAKRPVNRSLQLSGWRTVNRSPSGSDVNRWVR